MRTSKVKHRNGSHPRPFQWHNETNSLPFTILSHITYFLHFFTCPSLRSIPALTKLTASPGQGHRKGMWKYVECENNVKTLGSLGMKISRVFRFFFFKTVVHFSLFLYSKDSPRTLQGFSKAKALHVVQFGPLPPGPKACAWTSISNHSRCQVDGQRKRIKKNQQDAKSSLWVRLDSWSAFFDDLRCILYRLHTSKKTTWVLGHISNLSARTSTTWGDLACVTSSTWLLHAYTWIPWIYLAQARPEPVPNLRGCILSNVTSNIYVNIYMHEYRKIIYECNMQCNIASTHQPMHAALKEYEGIKPQMGATMSQTMSAY